MKKKLTFMFVALITVAAFAIQSKRAASALIDYPTSQSGITLYTLGTDGGVKFSEVAVKGTNVSAIEFGKSIKNTETEKYYAELSVEGGFKAGDIITINGCYSNKDAKETAIVFYKADLSTKLWTTDQFPNVNDGTTDVLVQSYTLTEDVGKIYCGRSGGTKTYLTKLTITREEASGDKYNVTVAEGITNGNVSVDKATAAEGEEVTITTTPADGYMLDAISVTCKTINHAVTVKDGKFTMPADDVTVNATFKVKPVDVAVAAGDITGGDITAAIAAKAAGKPIKDLTLTLTADASYTVTAPIVANGSVNITAAGEGSAVIDASGLTGNMIQMGDAALTEKVAVDAIAIENVSIKGLKKALFYSTGKNYDIKALTLKNDIIEVAEDVTTLDFTKGSNAMTISIDGSTIYAPTKTSKSFYSSQSAEKGSDYGATEAAPQVFSITNSTMYNLASGKNFFTHRQNSQKWLKFVAKNNIFVDCGKSGQTIKGMNGGGSSANPQFDIDGNIFNFEGKDTSADETTGDEAEPVKNSVAGMVTFKDAAAGDFNGTIALSPTTTSIPEQLGDGRWTLSTVTSYAITIADGIENGTVTTTPAGYAPKDAKVAVKATPASGYSVGSITVMNGETAVILDKDDNFTMPEAAVTVSATFVKAPVAITVAAEDITDGNINTALDAKIAALPAGDNVGNITITLAENGNYTLTKSIEAPASLTITGNGATIDASALESAMIVTPTGDLTRWMVGDFTVKGVKVTGLKKAFYASAGKNYLYNDFLIQNSVIEFNETSGFEFDFRKGGVAKNFTISGSTLYAPTATGNSMYTSQSAQRATEAPGVDMQTFTFENSTVYNLAKGKNFFTHRQSNQKWLAYTIKNSVFLNVGKSGQVIKGMNGGSSGTNPVWDIDGNVFNFDGADTSADETTGDDAEPVKNSIAGVVTFTDAAAGDFNFTFLAAPGTTAPATVGDPRWTLTPATAYTITLGEVKNGTITAVPYAAAGDKIYPKMTPAEGYAMDKIPVIKNGEGEDVTSTITFGQDETGVFFVMPAFNITVDYEFSKLYTITLPTETTHGTITIVDGDGNPMADPKFVAGKEVKFKVADLTSGYKVVVKNGETEITLNEGDHSKFDYYFTMPEGDVTFTIDEATGIIGINVDGVEDDIFSDGKPVYNLSGQRVFKGYKGIVIKNGKKIMVK